MSGRVQCVVCVVCAQIEAACKTCPSIASVLLSASQLTITIPKKEAGMRAGARTLEIQ